MILADFMQIYALFKLNGRNGARVSITTHHLEQIACV